MENNNLNAINSNLLKQFSGIVELNKVENNKPVVILNNVENNVSKTLDSLLNNLIDSIYNDIKDGIIINTKVLELVYKEQIEAINNLVNSSNIRIVNEGKYIRIYSNNIYVAYFSTYNKKLQPDNNGNGFLIWSIVGKITCYGKTAICDANCYNNHRAYNLKTKIRNYIFSLMDAFTQTVIKLIKEFKQYKKTYVRIHEDGDFYSMEYFNKWVEIAENIPEAVFMAYTKDFRVLKQINKYNNEYDNIVLRYSLMEDTKQNIIDYCIKNQVPVYCVLGSKKPSFCNKDGKKQLVQLQNSINNNPNTCINDCSKCKKCYTKNYLTVFQVIHN